MSVTWGMPRFSATPGPDLPRVTVDGLPAHEDDVRAAELAYGAGQRVGGGQGVGAGEGAVGHEVRVVRAEADGLPQRLRGLRAGPW